jgi:hypothetical protein
LRRARQLSFRSRPDPAFRRHLSSDRRRSAGVIFGVLRRASGSAAACAALPGLGMQPPPSERPADPAALRPPIVIVLTEPLSYRRQNLPWRFLPGAVCSKLDGLNGSSLAPAGPTSADALYHFVLRLLPAPRAAVLGSIVSKVQTRMLVAEASRPTIDRGSLNERSSRVVTGNALP